MTDDDKLEDLEKRLAAHPQRVEESAARKAEARESQQDRDNMNNGMRAGTELIASIGAGTLIGWGLDRWLGTEPFMLILFLLAGIGTGFYNIYRITQKIDGSAR